MLLLFDLSAGWTADDQALLARIPEVEHLLVGNKADLGARANGDDQVPVMDVQLSAQTGDGEADLVQAMLRRCGALSEQPCWSPSINARWIWLLRLLPRFSAVKKLRRRGSPGISGRLISVRRFRAWGRSPARS